MLWGVVDTLVGSAEAAVDERKKKTLIQILQVSLQYKDYRAVLPIPIEIAKN